MHIVDLVAQYGEDSVEKIYEEIDRRMLAFKEWLEISSDVDRSMHSIHLTNCHIFVEFLAEDSPCIFPEEVIDDDDGRLEIADETSTCFGLKQFVYCTYIRKGPQIDKFSDHILESILLYYQYLLHSGDIQSIPEVAQEIVYNPDLFQERLDWFKGINEEFSEDEEGWVKAFEAWEHSFYDIYNVTSSE